MLDEASAATLRSIRCGEMMPPSWEGTMFSKRLAVIAMMLAGTASSAHSMEISREQCELIRKHIIASASANKHYAEAIAQSGIVAMDLISLNFELKHINGGAGAGIIADRLQKDIDAISAASSDTSSVKSFAAEGLLAFMDVCGPPK